MTFLKSLQARLCAFLATASDYIAHQIRLASLAFAQWVESVTPFMRRLSRKSYLGYLAVFITATVLLTITSLVSAALKLFDDIRDIAHTPRGWREHFDS